MLFTWRKDKQRRQAWHASQTKNAKWYIHKNDQRVEECMPYRTIPLEGSSSLLRQRLRGRRWRRRCKRAEFTQGIISENTTDKGSSQPAGICWDWWCACEWAREDGNVFSNHHKQDTDMIIYFSSLRMALSAQTYSEHWEWTMGGRRREPSGLFVWCLVGSFLVASLSPWQFPKIPYPMFAYLWHRITRTTPPLSLVILGSRAVQQTLVVGRQLIFFGVYKVRLGPPHHLNRYPNESATKTSELVEDW